VSRKAWLQLVLPLIGLSVLFWLLAFAPSEKHHQPPLLELSVILRDGDGAVSTMRKGMEQAAQDLNVELRFLIPAEDNSAVQQAQLLEREVAGAAPAVRQQEEVSLRRKYEEEASCVPAGDRFYDVGSGNVHTLTPKSPRGPSEAPGPRR